MVSYALSLPAGLVRVRHMPLFVSVEPAAVCQLRCPACPVAFDNRVAKVHTAPLNGQATDVSALPKNHRFSGTPLMNRDVWGRVLEQVKAYAHTVQFYFQGEPLLNKGLPQMVREAHEAGLYTIVSTNAQALTPQLAEELVKAGLSRIIVSMDGLTQETYEAYRVGGSVEQCKAALRSVREAKNRLHGHTTIELQCLRLKTNEHEWKEFRKAYRTLGADRLTLKTAQLYGYEHGHPLMPSDERYSRYTHGSDGLYHRKPLSKGCWRAWSGVVITTAGDVLPCCYDKAHEHAYGNIMTAPLSEIFRNEKASAFRRAAFHQQPQICQECWK